MTSAWPTVRRHIRTCPHTFGDVCCVIRVKSFPKGVPRDHFWWRAGVPRSTCMFEDSSHVDTEQGAQLALRESAVPHGKHKCVRV